MDKKEFALFASAFRTYYSKENLLPNSQAMELWFRQLQDIPFPVAEATLNKWVATNKWSPSIAEIREMCAVIVNGEPRTWQDGWDAVLTAIRKFGYYNPKDAMAYLDGVDPIAASCALKMGWRNLCTSENAVADRAAFRGCYEIMAKREQQAQILPLPLQETIKQLADGMATNDKSGQSLLTDNERK